MESGATTSSRLKVFISYSRRDFEFVDRLQSALKARGIDAAIDRTEIEKGEAWWKRIQQLISECDTIIFVLSRASIGSKVCQDEVEFGESLRKRFLPIVIESLEGLRPPKGLTQLNYIFFTPNPTAGATGDFDEAVGDIASTLETNIEWIREHTRIGVLARRWTSQDRSKDQLLRGTDLKVAELWIITRPAKAPAPSDDHHAFIIQSRQAETQRKRRVMALTAALAIFLLSVGVLAATGALEPHFLRVQANRLTDLYAPTFLTRDREKNLHFGEAFKECASCPEMIAIAPGEFVMGSDHSDSPEDEAPTRTVKINYRFAVGRFEVTFFEWDGCVAHGGCEKEGAAAPQFGRGRHPVINVNWEDAKSFVAWLSRHTGADYRLLTEAEWEYVARAGSQSRFGYGDDSEQMSRYAWYNTDATREVGRKEPNKFGLYDTLGNVSEWVEDCYDKDAYKTAPTTGASLPASDDCYRVLRGGHFSADDDHQSVTYRNQMGGWRQSYNGFRVARTLTPP